MSGASNTLLGILNFLTLILSIPIIWVGVWLRNHGSSDCEKFLDTPVIVFGVFLLLVSVAGMFGSWCRISLLIWLYVLVMFLLILLLFCFTVFAFMVTNRGAGKVLSGKGYKEYKLGDYSNWLQKRVNSTKNWNRIKSCLVDGKVCSDFNQKYLHDTVEQLYSEHLSALQSGCCKPPDECGFTYVGPTNWTKSGSKWADMDCTLWANQHDVLCFNCNSCKAGLLENIKKDWKKVAIVNIVMLVFLIVAYSLGCCAFRNSRRGNYYMKA